MVERARRLRNHGSRERYYHDEIGYNHRMEGIQGAILGVKLRHMEAWTNARRTHAATYARLLSGTPVRVPVERPGSRHVFHVFAVRLAHVWQIRAAPFFSLLAGFVEPGESLEEAVVREIGEEEKAYLLSQKAGAIRHMCSGQHAAALLLSRLKGWDLETYWQPEHPSQVARCASKRRRSSSGS